MIRHCESAAVFKVDDPMKPVAWGMQHPCGQGANLYALKDYRKFGLGYIVSRSLGSKIIASGDIVEGVSMTRKLALHLGGSAMYQTTWLQTKLPEPLL